MKRKAKCVLGKGSLNWSRLERISDRYGTVALSKGEEPLELDEACGGCYGRLVAVVLEVHKSSHIGDLCRGLAPGGAKVGERIILGRGMLFFERDEGGHCVGLRPLNGRETDWLNPKALYKVHEQTVELVFEEMKEPTRRSNVRATTRRGV